MNHRYQEAAFESVIEAHLLAIRNNRGQTTVSSYNVASPLLMKLTMPTISMFYGILVAMYVLDTEKHHHPHIHIRYNDFKAVLRIPDGELLEGDLPKRQMKLVQAWIELHQDDLMADWYLASTGQTPFRIDPLR